MEAKIRHMVVFNLKYPKDDPRAQEFLDTAKRMLGPITYAMNVEQCYQTNAMCKYDFGFSFDFASQDDYEGYNNHPDHKQFVEEWWKTQVSDFMEVDFAKIL